MPASKISGKDRKVPRRPIPMYRRPDPRRAKIYLGRQDPNREDAKIATRPTSTSPRSQDRPDLRTRQDLRNDKIGTDPGRLATPRRQTKSFFPERQVLHLVSNPENDPVESQIR